MTLFHFCCSLTAGGASILASRVLRGSRIMAVSALLASLLLAQAQAPVDVAYNELRAGDPVAAIAKIARSDARQESHPAALINLGIAYARVGRTAEARAAFEAAAGSNERFRLETASGEWMD